ncbi:fumarate hydratase [Holophaga foetida]|uniref:fumarate hydratase n=1 Tax=Holophaga foetida TaxID=35839 RepID=UPI0002474D13|nr:fumarate hydratase [Holophaga foetida]
MTECSLTSLEAVEAHSVLPKDWRVDLGDLSSLDLTLSALELIRRATSRLPQDVITALARGRASEAEGSRAANTLGTMLENVELADRHVAPLCQDTGTVIFWVRHPFGASQRALKQQVRQAVVEATNRSWLRPNCVAALSGKNPGNNLDPFKEGHPVIHFEEWERPEVEIDIMLKGGGCENVGGQYRLPDVTLGAGRDLKGVRKCIIDAVVKAQGQGCAPGILGVAIGGDRVTGYEKSKELLMRRLDVANPDPRMDEFEKALVADLNTLGIGPMGYSGHTTVLGVSVEEMFRHPASFYVSISYMCWSSRRMTLRLQNASPAIFE